MSNQKTTHSNDTTQMTLFPLEVEDGLCQVILGRVIIPIFQTLRNCTLFATALRLLAESSYKVRKTRTL